MQHAADPDKPAVKQAITIAKAVSGFRAGIYPEKHHLKSFIKTLIFRQF